MRKLTESAQRGICGGKWRCKLCGKTTNTYTWMAGHVRSAFIHNKFFFWSYIEKV